MFKAIINKHKEYLISIFFSSMLIFSGFDKLSIDIGVGTLRLFFVISILTFTFVIVKYKFKIHIPSLSLFLLFAALSIPSIIFATNTLRSISYILYWFTVFFSIFFLFLNLSSNSRVDIRSIILNAYRVQIIIAVLLYVSGLQERADLLYYEPSYFAISCLMYVAIVFFNVIRGRENYYIDLLLIVLLVYVTKSAALILGLTMIGLGTFFLNIKKRKTYILLFPASIVATIVFMSFYFFVSSDDLILSSIKDILISEDLLQATLDRAQNRVPRVGLAYEVAKNNLLGVGPGNYISFIDNYDAENYYYEDIWYLSPQGLPAINIYLEMSAENGILATLVFLVGITCILYSLFKSRNYDYFLGFFVTLLILNIESSYMRVYFWVMLGLVFGEYMRSCKHKKILATN